MTRNKSSGCVFLNFLFFGNFSGDILSLLIKINLFYFFSIIIYNILMNVIFLKPVAWSVEEIVHSGIVTIVNVVVLKKIKERGV